MAFYMHMRPRGLLARPLFSNIAARRPPLCNAR